MNLLNDLIDFYDKFHNDRDFWEKARDGSGFLPITHMALGRKPSVVCITLDREGDFVSARRLDLSKNGSDYPVIYPVTIPSASRTKCTPHLAHPLTDQYRYLVMDGDPNPAYLERLEDWMQNTNSVSACGIIKSIHDYVGKNTMGDDLKTIAKSGVSGSTYITWAVILDGECQEVWKEDTLIQSYIEYNDIVIKRKPQSQCMATGGMDYIPSTYPPSTLCWGIAKLFSSYETQSVRQAAMSHKGQENMVFVGYHAAEKISSAVHWLEKNSSDIRDDMAIMCWSPDGRVKQNTLSMLFGGQTEVTAGEWGSELRATVNNSFGKAMLPPDAPIHILILKRVVSTRISVMYYDRFAAGQLRANLARWNNGCKAIYPYSKTGEYEVSSPALYQLALHAVGREVNKEFKASAEELNNLYAKLVVDHVKGNPLTDIVVKGTQRNFEKRYTIESNKERIYVEYAAAAVVRKHMTDTSGKEPPMSLDVESKDVSYQYGRLLAVLERIELDYNWSHGNNRPLMTVRRNPAFVQRPLQVAAELWQKSRAVYLRSCPKAGYYSKLVQEILDTIADLPDRDKPLQETYILGYSAQMQEFRVKAAKADKTTEEETQHG